jgi:hypothetical protein
VISKTITPPPPPPIIIKQVVKLPNTASSSTQTERDMFNDEPSSGAGASHSNPHNLMDTTPADLSMQTDVVFDFSDLATQTDFQHFDLSNFATQTDFTQTDHSSTGGQSFDFSDLATQTDFPCQHNLDASFDFSDLSTQTDCAEMEHATSANELFSNLSTQTDFDHKTAANELFSNFSTQTDFDSKTSATELFSNLSTQTDCVLTQPRECSLTDFTQSPAQQVSTHSTVAP